MTRICWHIFRLNNTETLTKAHGTDCPCTHDPINNPHCHLYEEVVIHESIQEISQ